MSEQQILPITDEMRSALIPFLVDTVIHAFSQGVNSKEEEETTPEVTVDYAKGRNAKIGSPSPLLDEFMAMKKDLEKKTAALHEYDNLGKVKKMQARIEELQNELSQHNSGLDQTVIRAIRNIVGRPSLILQEAVKDAILCARMQEMERIIMIMVKEWDWDGDKLRKFLVRDAECTQPEYEHAYVSREAEAKALLKVVERVINNTKGFAPRPGIHIADALVDFQAEFEALKRIMPTYPTWEDPIQIKE
jgi:hypothetical protein